MTTFELPFPLESVSSFFGPRRIMAESREIIPLWAEVPPVGDIIWEDHTGIDYRQPEGTPIHCPADGVASLVTDGSEPEGFSIYIQHGEHGAVMSMCAHLSGIPDLEEGQRVSQGQVIGYVGSSGNSTGPHLHFETLVRGIPYNPLTISTKWTHCNSVDWDSTANTQEEINGGN